MIKRKLIYLFFVFMIANYVCANDCEFENKYKKPKTLKEFKQQKEKDLMFKERLNLTDEQVEILKENRAKHRKEIEKLVKQMQVLHDEIRDIYLLGLPKFQTDLRTAPKKAELVILKQNATNLKKQYSKQILDCLNEEQKLEFYKIREEKKEKINKTSK